MVLSHILHAHISSIITWWCSCNGSLCDHMNTYKHMLNRHKGGLKTPEGTVAGTNRCKGAMRCIPSSFSFVLFYFLCSFFFSLLTTSFQAVNHPVMAQICTSMPNN